SLRWLLLDRRDPRADPAVHHAVRITRSIARVISSSSVVVSGAARNANAAPVAVDTGATETLIIPDVLDELGYSPRRGEAITVIRSAVGREEGYLIRVARFAALGFQLKDFRVHAHDLPEGFDIDGLLGLGFLKQFDYQIPRSRAASWSFEQSSK